MHPQFERFLRALATKGGVWIVGGWVRDVLLELPPHDADFATSASAECIASLVAEHRLAIIHDTVARAHGTYRIHLPGTQHVLDVALLRQDVAPTGSRYAHIALTQDICHDLARRDLTINSMAIAYPWERNPLVLDPFDGQKDLTQKRLRFVGEPARRLDEDPLRLLRLARFAALGTSWHVDESTALALEAAAPSLSRVAQERMSQEMWRALALPAPQRFFEVLGGAKALSFVLGPPFAALAFDGTSAAQWLLHAAAASEDPVARWVAWWLGGLGAVDPHMVLPAARRDTLMALLRPLRVPRTIQAEVARTVALFPWHPSHYEGPQLARWMLETGEASYALMQPAIAAAIAADANARPMWQQLRGRIEHMAQGTPWCISRPLGIDGQDLMQNHHVTAGPHLGAHLQALAITALVEGIWGDSRALGHAAARRLRLETTPS